MDCDNLNTSNVCDEVAQVELEMLRNSKQNDEVAQVELELCSVLPFLTVKLNNPPFAE